MMERLQKVGMRSLRQSRVRLDSLAMLVVRAFLEVSMAELQNIHLHLFVDGSPQWRGQEFLADTLGLAFRPSLSSFRKVVFQNPENPRKVDTRGPHAPSLLRHMPWRLARLRREGGEGRRDSHWPMRRVRRAPKNLPDLRPHPAAHRARSLLRPIADKKTVIRETRDENGMRSRALIPLRDTTITIEFTLCAPRTRIQLDQTIANL